MLKWARRMTPMANEQNLIGQNKLYRCLVTGFVTSAPALARYQKGRGIPTDQREFVGLKPDGWKRSKPKQTCSNCGAVIQGGPKGLKAHHQSKRCQAA